MAVGAGLWLSTVVGALAGVGLRPLGVGQLSGEDEAGDGGDGGEDEVLCVVGLGCGEFRDEDRHGCSVGAAGVVDLTANQVGASLRAGLGRLG